MNSVTTYSTNKEEMEEERGKRKRMGLFCFKLVSANSIFFAEIGMTEDEEEVGGFSGVPLLGIILDDNNNYFATAFPHNHIIYDVFFL